MLENIETQEVDKEIGAGAGLSAPYFTLGRLKSLVAEAQQGDKHKQGEGGEAGDGGDREGHV